MSPIRWIAIALALPLALACPALSVEAPAALAITNARIFDGTRLFPGKGVVVVRDGRIVAAGPDARVPEGAQVVDAAGATLLPGLIDSHTHVFGNALERALIFGVTTELDMFTLPGLAQQSLVAGPEWERHAIPLAQFAGVDPSAITGIFFGAGPELGAFRFRIDNVQLAAGQTP